MKLVDDNKRVAADHLKSADKLIKAGEFDRATEEITKAREADPRNLYILAYEERIQYARDEAIKKAEKEQMEPGNVAQAAQPKKKEEPPPAPEEARKQTEEKKEPAAPQKIEKSEKTEKPEKAAEKPHAESVPKLEIPPPEKHANFEQFIIKANDIDSVLDLIRSNADKFSRTSVEEAREKAQSEYKSKIENDIRDYEIQNQKRQAEQIQIAVATFQKKLETESQIKLEAEISAMSKNAEKYLEERLLHLEDERELRNAELLKELFTIAIEQLLIQGMTDDEYTKVITGIAYGLKISPEQTLHMKKKTQERFYLDAVEVAWSDGTVSLEESERLATLRDRFGITPEEHFHLESVVRRKMLDVKK